MGLFDRRNREIKRDAEGAESTESTSTSTGYSVPTGLSFSLERILSADNNCVSAYYSGIELISNSLALVPILVKKISDQTIVEKSKLYDIFRNGNVSKFLTIKQLVKDAYNYGNGFAYIKRGSDGRPVDLIYRPHGCVTIVYNPTTLKLYYLDPIVSSRKIEPVNMIHIRKDTLDGINGTSLAKIGAKIFDLAKSTDSTAKDFFDSGCNVSGVLTSTKPLNPGQKMEILQDWRAAFNKQKANNVGVLGYDLKYTPVTNNANDSQLLQSREFNVLEIARYLNINPLLLGVQHGGSAYGSLESAQLDLIIHTLLPWIYLIEEEFNNKLILPSERGKIYIDFDEDKIMFASKSDTANYYTTLVKNGILSINEARTALGYGEKDGLDENFIPYTNLAHNKVNGSGSDEEEEKPQEVEEENEEKDDTV